MDKENNGEYVASIAGGRGGGGEGRMDDGGTRGVAGRFSLSTKFQVSGETKGKNGSRFVFDEHRHCFLWSVLRGGIGGWCCVHIHLRIVLVPFGVGGWGGGATRWWVEWIEWPYANLLIVWFRAEWVSGGLRAQDTSFSCEGHHPPGVPKRIKFILLP